MFKIKTISSRKEDVLFYIGKKFQINSGVIYKVYNYRSEDKAFIVTEQGAYIKIKDFFEGLYDDGTIKIIEDVQTEDNL